MLLLLRLGCCIAMTTCAAVDACTQLSCEAAMHADACEQLRIERLWLLELCPHMRGMCFQCMNDSQHCRAA